MISIDRDGLSLCKLQGKLFEKSLEFVKTSSSIFIRRFMNSNIVLEFDTKEILDDTKPIETIYEILDEEFGESEYGSVKYNAEVLYWIGYIYRYFSYTYELNSKQVYKIIKPKELNERYYVYHTFDPAYAIERILEEKNISFNQDDLKNKSLNLLREDYYKETISLSKNIKTNKYELKEDDDSLVDGYNILKVMIKDEIVGESRINKIDEETAKFTIEMIENRFSNEVFYKIAIEKLSLLAKEKMKVKKLIISLPVDDNEIIDVYKKNGFSYYKEDEQFVYLEKII